MDAPELPWIHRRLCLFPSSNRSQQAAVHELIDGAASRIRNSLDPADETAQKDDLRLPCGLFLLPLESDQLDGVEVDGQQCVVDRGRQIAQIPPLLAQQLVQTH